MIECYGICSENCTAWQNGKCVLDAKKAEGVNDFQLLFATEENVVVAKIATTTQHGAISRKDDISYARVL